MTSEPTILKMEDILNKADNSSKSELQKGMKQKKLVPNPNLVPRGKPKSGRIWKTEKKKFSSIIKTKGIKSSLDKNRALREELKRVKEASNAIKEAKREKEELRKQRRRENLKRQEENRRKSEVVQVISNTKKLKKIKKKQLKYIEKRDTTVVDRSK